MKYQKGREISMIRNKEDLRFEYVLLRFADGKYPDIVKDVKRNIRNYYKQNAKRNRRIVHGDFDYFVELVELPEFIETQDMASEYFEENIRLVCMPSQYDCTGQLFTSWYKPVKRNGRWYVYHGVSMDV